MHNFISHLCGYCNYSQLKKALKPRLTPDLQELLINEGESLEITCLSSRQIKLFYPQHDIYNRTKPSAHQIEFQDVNGPAMQWKFRRNKTIFGDTGWYGCADTAAEISSGRYYHPNASFVYVYVQSNVSGFTEDAKAYTFSYLNKPIYIDDDESEFIVPCRTTSPYLNVTLLYDNSTMTVEAENIVSYDPKIGFIVKNFIANKQEDLTCNATLSTDDEFSSKISYSVRKKKISPHKTPEIVIFGEWMSQIYFDVNGDLIVMCKIQVANKAHWGVTLSTPRGDIRGMHEIKKLSDNEVEVSCQYLLRDLTYESMGMYTCQFTGHREVLTTERYIHVHDNSSILMLQLHDYGADVVEHDNVNIICMANNVSASLSWLDVYMNPVINSDRLNIVAVDDSNAADHLYNYLRLDLINVTKSNETIYICKSVDENDINHYRYYNLVVEEPEAVEFTDVNLNNTEIIIDDANPHEPILKCGAKGRPKPAVSWYQDGVQLQKDTDTPVSKKELDLPVQEREEHYQQFIDQEYLPGDDNNPQILSIKYLVLKVSTNYTCVAKNKFGEVKAFQIFSIPGKNDWAHPAIAFFVIIIAIVICNYGFIKIQSRTARRRCMREAGLLYFQNITDEELSPITMIYDQVDLLRYDKKWEFTRERLKLEKKLGSGAFGIVIKAKAYGINPHEAVTTVAVKMVRQYAETFQVRALASELKIMIYLGRHLNIVNLLGACTTNITKRELLVIVEYCPFGNLHDYLLTHRKQFIDQIDKKTGVIDFSIGQAEVVDECLPCLSKESSDEIKSTDNTLRSQSLCTQDLISWAFQVARGMEYLSQKNVLHGDLAARNILLTHNNVVKICDFGLAKVMEDDSYMKRSRGLLPIKWMAIESIRDRVFSVHSDAWSFGIVLWEFFTLAQVPYCDILPEVQLQKLLKGHRLEKPKYANDELYCLMVPCWNEEPTLRPTFTMLVEQLGNLLEENVKTYYLDLSTLDESINALDSRYQNSYLSTTRCNA